jgi:hypothetical protein
MKPETLETKLLKRIDRKRGDVFLRADFDDLGGYDQVGRVLRQLVREGRLVKIGQGLYARARPSMTSGEPVPVGGLSALKEALRRQCRISCWSRTIMMSAWPLSKYCLRRATR